MPDLDIATADLNQEGLVNDVVIVNNTVVFRFPKDDGAVEALAHEANVLSLVRRHVSLPAPVFENLEKDVAVYRHLPGVPLLRNDLLRLPEVAQDRLAEQLATLLRELHAIPLEAVEACGIGPSATVRAPEDWQRLYRDVQTELFPLMMDHSKTWVHQHFEAAFGRPGFFDHDPVLMDGDLAPYHLLFDPVQVTLAGKIDYGTAGLGDPTCDTACILYQYGETVLRRMARFYPTLLQNLDRARFWAGTLELQWALGGVRSDDQSWFLVHLGSARDVFPLGLTNEAE